MPEKVFFLNVKNVKNENIFFIEFSAYTITLYDFFHSCLKQHCLSSLKYKLQNCFSFNNVSTRLESARDPAASRYRPIFTMPLLDIAS